MHATDRSSPGPRPVHPGSPTSSQSSRARCQPCVPVRRETDAARRRDPRRLLAASGDPGHRARGRLSKRPPGPPPIDSRMARISSGSSPRRSAPGSAGSGLLEVEALEIEQSAELADRIIVGVDPQVDPSVVPTAEAATPRERPGGPPTRDRGRSPPAASAAARHATSSSGNGRPAGQVRLGQAIHHAGPGQDVALGREAGAYADRRPRRSNPPPVCVAELAAGVDDAHLALLHAGRRPRPAAQERLRRARPRRPAARARPARTRRSANDCVAIAPTPALCPRARPPRPPGTFDWTATPRSPVAGSRATIE